MTTAGTDPFDGPTRIDLEETPLAVVRHREVRLAELPGLFDRGYAALGAAFASGTLTPAGPALAIYHGDPQAAFALELGFPVLAAPAFPLVQVGVEIEGGTLPAGPALVTSHLGSYDGLGPAWGRFMESLGPGDVPAGPFLEVYVTDPSQAEAADLRTDLVLPLRG